MTGSTAKKKNLSQKKKQIMKKYEEEILPLICKEGDDGQYGSSAVCDIQALQVRLLCSKVEVLIVV